MKIDKKALPFTVFDFSITPAPITSSEKRRGSVLDGRKCSCRGEAERSAGERLQTDFGTSWRLQKRKEFARGGWSAGKLPSGVSPEVLSKEHNSVRRNLIIADVFYRAGMIENWGRGTNRVIDQCREAGISTPEFRVVGNFTVVTFRVKVGQTAQVTDQVSVFCREPRSAKDIMVKLGLKHKPTFRSNYLIPLMSMGILEMTIPDKPQSRLQKYRTTKAGMEIIKNKKSECTSVSVKGSDLHLTTSCLASGKKQSICWTPL